MDVESSHGYEFGPLYLDPARRMLLREGQPVSLTAKAFDTLLVLIENRDRVVDKNELLKSVWPDTFVGEATLAQNIFKIRKALGQDPDGHPYIVTIPKRGYRFVGRVTPLEDQPANVEGERPAKAALSASDEEAASESQVKSLAIMPLDNLSDDPNAEYLSDGITENTINKLSQLHDLRVAARSTVFRYKGKNFDPRKVGRDLSVNYVMVGRVSLMGDQLIVKAELVDVVNGWQLWGDKQYVHKLANIFEFEEEIATHISEELRLTLTKKEHEQIRTQYTENSKAYLLYLEGRHHWNKRTEEGLRNAIELFKQAIKIDAHYTLALFSLADAYVSFDFRGLLPPKETMPEAKAAASKAIEIDPGLAQPYTSLGCVKLIYDRDWDGAEKEFKRAIELDPKYAAAHNWYSQYLMAKGQIEESFHESQIALNLEPFDLSTNLHLGWHYLHARNYDGAIEQLNKVMELEPKFFLAHFLLGMAYEQQGNFSEALAEFKEASLLENSPILLGFLGYTYAALGDRTKALEILDELRKRSKGSYVPAYSMALIHSRLGEQDEAFEHLGEASNERNQWLTWLNVAAEFDSLRSDPRFETLVRRANLD
jgi:TolB-like protein/Tfp pilus assembly protein PilF